MARKKSTKNNILQKEETTMALFEKGFWRKNILPASILFFLALGLYAYSTTFDYVLDDQIVLTNNSFTNTLSSNKDKPKKAGKRINPFLSH